MKILLCLNLLLLIQCKQDPLVSEKALNRVLLSSRSEPWSLENLTIDGMNETELFTGLAIKFTPTNFTAINGSPVWPESGSWVFTDESGKTILRDDDVSITIVEISESVLRLELQWDKTTYSNGRASSLKGDHLFTFKR